jgi:hypothetical protein
MCLKIVKLHFPYTVVRTQNFRSHIFKFRNSNFQIFKFSNGMGSNSRVKFNHLDKDRIALRKHCDDDGGPHAQLTR